MRSLASWPDAAAGSNLAFMPARVIMQDLTGVPAVVDLAAMRAAVARAGGDPARVDPLVPVDLVVDHSVQVDAFGSDRAYARNIEREFERNGERYALLRWAQGAFRNFRVVPPGMGIVHQVNLEYLGRVVQVRDGVAMPDTLVGTDSHTTMINALGVLGWGVGGIEAEAVMLGQPLYMLSPVVLGVRMSGELGAGVTATDLVLTLTERLRGHGVVGKFVEFFGPGVPALTVADRATISNMSPEFGSTAAMFPVDHRTIGYLRDTGRDADLLGLVESYCKEQGLYRTGEEDAPVFSETIDFDLTQVEPSLAGPRRPQDRVSLGRVPESFSDSFAVAHGNGSELGDGSVAIAAITSCTNTSNPSLMIAAGLLAKKAVERGHGDQALGQDQPGAGLARGGRLPRPGRADRVPGRAALQPGRLRLHHLHRQLRTAAGRGQRRDLAERPVGRGRAVGQPQLRGAHPPAGAGQLPGLAAAGGRVRAGRQRQHRPHQPAGRQRPRRQPGDARRALADRRRGRTGRGRRASRRALRPISTAASSTATSAGASCRCRPASCSSGIRTRPTCGRPPSSSDRPTCPTSSDARLLAILGDSVTTDHISPAGSIASSTPAGRYLIEHGVEPRDFNSYGARRGNHEVMVRGTFANIRLRNRIVEGVEGGFTRHLPDGEQMSIYDASMRYQADGVPLVVIAGKEYGSGSSRDWAAKGSALLGVRAVIAESYERIHRTEPGGAGRDPAAVPGGRLGRVAGHHRHRDVHDPRPGRARGGRAR